MSTNAFQRMLFGGAIFAAGIARADTHFTFAVGPAGGYAISGSIDLGGNVNGILATSPDDLPQVTADHLECDGHGYAYRAYYSQATITVGQGVISTYAEAYGCVALSTWVRAYFEVTTPSRFRLLWGSVNATVLTAGVWSVGTGGSATLTAGPGDDARFLAFGDHVFALGPGLYYTEIALEAVEHGIGLPYGDLVPLGDACACDLDANGDLNIDDVDAFGSYFLAGSLSADQDGSGTLNIDDVDAFAACFLGACP